MITVARSLDLIQVEEHLQGHDLGVGELLVCIWLEGLPAVSLTLWALCKSCFSSSRFLFWFTKVGKHSWFSATEEDIGLPRFARVS